MIMKFKRVENIEKATEKEIAETQSITIKDAENIKKYFKEKKEAKEKDGTE